MEIEPNSQRTYQARRLPFSALLVNRRAASHILPPHGILRTRNDRERSLQELSGVYLVPQTDLVSGEQEAANRSAMRQIICRTEFASQGKELGVEEACAQFDQHFAIEERDSLECIPGHVLSTKVQELWTPGSWVFLSSSNAPVSICAAFVIRPKAQFMNWLEEVARHWKMSQSPHFYEEDPIFVIDHNYEGLIEQSESFAALKACMLEACLSGFGPPKHLIPRQMDCETFDSFFVAEFRKHVYLV